MTGNLAERINARMRDLPMQQVDLARRVGVKPPSVAGWRTGRTQSLKGETLIKAAAALQVSPDWLATGKGAMQPNAMSSVQEPAPVYDDPLVVEAAEIMRALPYKRRLEALSFLRVYATKKGAA